MQSPHDVWTRYELDKPLANAEGGEGGIYTLKPHAGDKRVAKIYNQASKALLKPDAFKSLAFLTSKYTELSKPGVLPFVAWPIEVLFTVKHPSTLQHLQTLAGITMRHVSGHGVLELLTTNGNGRFGLGTEKAVRIAATLASYLNKMHERSIVFCDFNPKNVLVSHDHKTLTFVDADAFQHPFGTVFTKPHYFPGYASPAHIEGRPGPRSPADDNFVLAIHIFQLLLDGGHPFDTGPAYNPTGDPFATITPHDNIKARRWPYSNVPLYRPPGETPKHYDRLHPELRAMFTQAFQLFNPPTAAQWENALPKFVSNLEGPTQPKSAQPQRPATPPVTPHVPPTPTPPPVRPTVNVQLPPIPPSPRIVIQPPPEPLTFKRMAWIALAFLAKNLKRFLMIALRWAGRTLANLAVAGGRRMMKRGNVEIVVGLLAVAGLFWALHAYNAKLTAKPSPDWTAVTIQSPAPANPPDPVVTNPAVKKRGAPPPAQAALAKPAPTKATPSKPAPAKPTAAKPSGKDPVSPPDYAWPEELPWRTETKQPTLQLTPSTPPTAKPLTDREKRMQALQRRIDRKIEAFQRERERNLQQRLREAAQ